MPTASGVPLDRLPRQIEGVRIIGIDVPGFGVPTHAEAKDVLAGAMLRYARQEAEQGPVQRPRGPQADEPRVTLIGELFPGDPVGVGGLLKPMGLAVARRCRPASGAISTPRWIARSPLPSTRSTRPRSASSTAGRPVVGSGPVGVEGTAAWLEAIGKACGIPAEKIDAAKAAALPAIRAALAANRSRRASPVRLRGLGTAGGPAADRERRAGAYVGTACPRTRWSDPDREWLEARARTSSTARRSSRTSRR